MREASRTKRTLQNSRMSLVLFLVQIVVGFYSRKVFLDYLGAEVLGLNTTLGNILSFMNLAELGIGIAMSTSLYKPIHEDDQETICEIISVQGWLYRRVALLILIAGVAVMALLPFLFPNTECGLAYVYSSFAVFLFGTLTSYWWNYRQVLIGADQKNYKLQPWMHVVRYAVMGLQIFCLLIVDLGIWGWLFWTFLGNVLIVFVINAVLKKEYPWLHQSRVKGKELLDKYYHLIVMTKQLFVHKLAQFIIEQTTPLIIYAFVSLTMVTYYANYMMLIGYTVTLMNVVFEGMGASIGNLVAEKQHRHTLEVFWELFTSRLWIAALACFALYLSIVPFISLWIGSQYLLSDSTQLLLVVSMFIRMTRSVIDSFKNAYQLFADTWAPIVEGVLHLGGGLVLGWMWGLNGILLGGIVSQVVIVLLWKPYYTFRYGLKTSPRHYFWQYLTHCTLLLGCAVIIMYLCKLFHFHSETKGWISLFSYVTLTILLYTFSTFALLYVFTGSMRRFTYRIINILKRRI